jgi:hypothetical protein
MSTGRDPASRASAAIAAGVSFLSAAQLPEGELTIRTWRPAAPQPVPDPSVFGTALIASSLLSIPETAVLRDRACAFIARHCERYGVWRHWTRGHPQFRYVPPDLDDTAVASIALAKNGRAVPENRSLLLSNRDGNGCFFSWISLRARWVPHLAYWWISGVHLLRHPLHSILFYSITPSERRDVDAVVNANVLYYLGPSPETQPVVEFLLRVLREGRETSSDKWYDNPFVIWYFFSRALHAAGVDCGPLVLSRLHGATAESALERALAVCVQLDWNERPSHEAIRGLLDAQLPSGAWPLAAVYKGRNVRWGSEELTTGFCLEALRRWLSGERP